ncbi:caspase recruitment domain-containing protein 8-like [Sphaeramia orbicularis]|uniref:caspase recruitment domain-containing protein 8-like n=1 Tax=Sphaeramia orbicularis TaxID=375764 RepID=UPI00117F6260|nr:caspase recruitment domain-containing protein 8-like [Sphaeramia orbicularis]
MSTAQAENNMDEGSSVSSAGDDERMQTPATCFRRVTRRIWTTLFRIHRNDPPPPDTTMRLKLPSCLDFDIPTVNQIMLLNEDECIFDFVSLITPSHPQRKHTNDAYRSVDTFTVHPSISSPVPYGRYHQTRVLLHNPTEPQIDQQNKSVGKPHVTEAQNSPTHPPAQLHHINASSGHGRKPVVKVGGKGAVVETGIFCLRATCSLEQSESDGAAEHKSLSYSPLSSLHHINPSSGPGPSPGDKHVFRCVSVPSMIENHHVKENLRRTLSLPSMVLNSSFKEFTPVTVGEMDEAYRFQSSCPGLYQCSVTGLVFGMETDGVVVYRTVPWDRRMLDQYHKKPAGPLFDITCVDKSVVQLHLPHCELRPTGGWDFLSVAHVEDDGSVQFIRPQKITETHVVISITGFSPVGNVKDKDSPLVPVQALVLLFFRPSPDPDDESVLNVLLLPKNVSLRDVQRTRKALVGDEIYIETSSDCKLQPEQVYTLTTSPEDSEVQPGDAEFDEDSYDNYIPKFQVFLNTGVKHLKLVLKDKHSSHSVWQRRVCLSPTGVNASSRSRSVNLTPNQRLLDVLSGFIHGVSEPNLKSLLDKLLEKGVVSDAEMDEVKGMQTRADKARFVIDTVRRKGKKASSEMIEFLRELDPYLCDDLDLN